MSDTSQFIWDMLTEPVTRRPRVLDGRAPATRSPRCPICGDFLGKRPVRYVDGIPSHRVCLGDGQGPDEF